MADTKSSNRDLANVPPIRRRVLDALAHRQPKRVPFSWGFGPTAEMQDILRKAFAPQGIDWDRLCEVTNDKTGVGPAHISRPNWPGWGIKTKTANYGGGSYEEFTDFPLGNMTDPRQVRDYPWPSADPFDYPGLRAGIAKANPGGAKAVQLGGGNPFEIYCWLTGLETALTNMVTSPEIVTTALDCITTHMETMLERSLKAAGDLVDMIFFADDLGTQNGLMISRQMYRDILQPFHKRLTACAKKYAPHATRMLHSDGAVFDILPDLIDSGIQMLEAVQTDAAGMVPRRLKETFGRQLSFHGGISVQHLLPHCDAATVRRGCLEMVEILGAGGGYIAAPAHAIQVGTPPQNVLVMLQAVLGQEDYARAIEAAKV